MTLWDVVVPAATSALAAIIAFFAGKRKSNAEADGVIVTNAEKVIALYAKMAERHEQRLEALENQVQSLKDQYEELQLKYEAERARNKIAQKENEILQEKYDNLNKRLNGSQD